MRKVNYDNCPKIDIKILHEELKNYTEVDFNDVFGLKIIIDRRTNEEGISGELRIILKEIKPHKQWYEWNGERRYHQYNRNEIYIDDSYFVEEYFEEEQVRYDVAKVEDIKRMLSEEFLHYLKENPSFELWFNEKKVIDLFEESEDEIFYEFGEDWGT